MNNREQLAVLTALKKAVDARLAEVRDIADEELKAAYQDDGIEKVALKLGNEKVGEFTVTFNKDGWDIVDKKEFNDFALANGLAHTQEQIKPEFVYICVDKLRDVLDEDEFNKFIQTDVVLEKDWDKHFKAVDDVVIMAGTNEVVPGVRYRPKRLRNTMVRECKPDVVIPKLRELGGVERLLLEES